MKNKKLLLPAMILLVAILAISVSVALWSIAKKPTITEGEFPFSITYEFNGETVTIKDVYKARYDRNGGYADTKERIYVGGISNLGENNTVYILKQGENDGVENNSIELWTHFYADYMMGDADQYEYFNEEEPFEPRIYYYDDQGNEYHDEETLSAQGVRLISFEYPKPIENSFVFSHISYLSGEVSVLMSLIALLTLLAMLIFVRKEKELKYKAIDVISIVLNFVIFFTFIPFVSILAVLIDVEGGGPEFYYQAMYFIPAISVLCLAASVALRRKGYSVKSLIAELSGPGVFALYLLISAIIGF